MRLKAVTNPSQGEGIAARQELANQRPRPKDSGLNPFHFPEVATQDILTIQTGAEPVFKRIFNIRKISRPKTDRGQALNTTVHELTHTPQDKA